MSSARVSKDHIVEVASEIADAEGLDAINTNRLAERLRIKAPSLYRHFPNVGAIKDALATRALGEMIDLHKDMARGRSGRDALQALAHAERTYAQARPGRYVSAVQGGQMRLASIASLRQTYVRLVASTLETYNLDSDGAVEVSRCLLAALQGFIVVELRGGLGSSHDADQCYDRLLEILDAGVRAAARSAANRIRGRAAATLPRPVDHERGRLSGKVDNVELGLSPDAGMPSIA
jgi:AcrR family transcriptional regulator